MLKVTEIKMTCSACPSQWEGKLEDGRYFYARYRWGHLSFTVSDTSVDDAVFGALLYDGEHGDGYDGVMSTEDMLRHVGAVV